MEDVYPNWGSIMEDVYPNWGSMQPIATHQSRMNIVDNICLESKNK